MSKNITNIFDKNVMSSCPICNEQQNFSHIEKYDDRFGQPDLFEYNLCENCNIAFLKNKLAEEHLPELYQKYYGKDEHLNNGFDILKFFLEIFGLDKIVFQWLGGNKILLNCVKKNSKVLEIGPGYSPDLKKIIHARHLDWTGLEVNEESAKKLKNDNLRVIHGTINLNNIQAKFDCIIASQSLEHQYDVNDFFKNSNKILESGGKIIFTTPNFNSRYRKKYEGKWINWHAPYHVTILSKKGIENLCEKFGFKIEKFSTYTPTSWHSLQRNFQLPKRGEKNQTFNFNFSRIGQLFVSIFLRSYEFFDKKTGDCIYCELIKK